MYKHTKLICIVIILCFFLNANLSVYASANGFSTEPLSEKETMTVLSNFKIDEIEEEPIHKPIDCFDVNEKENIVIGISDGERKEVVVYNSLHEFIKGYEFIDSGSFGIEWNDDEINIYLVRSDISVTINENGDIDNIVGIKNSMENDSYWNHSVFSNIRFVGTHKYELRNNLGILNLFSSSYSQLIQVDENDSEIILYDVSHESLIYSFIIIICVVIFIAIIVFIIIHRCKNKN